MIRSRGNRIFQPCGEQLGLLDAAPRWIRDRRALRPETAEVQAQWVGAAFPRRDIVCSLRRSRLRPPDIDSLLMRDVNPTVEASEYRNFDRKIKL